METRPLTLADTAFTCVLRCIPKSFWIASILLILLSVCILAVSTYFYSEASAIRAHQRGLDQSAYSIHSEVVRLVSEEVEGEFKNNPQTRTDDRDYLSHILLLGEQMREQERERVLNRLQENEEYQQLQDELLESNMRLDRCELLSEAGFIVGACGFAPFVLIIALQFVAATFTIIVYVYYGVVTGILKHVRNVQRISKPQSDD